MIVSSGRKSTYLSSSFSDSLIIGSASVPHSVKSLGVTLDCHLTMRTHISTPVRSANFKLHRISWIRHLCPQIQQVFSVSGIVLSRRDYCNSLLSGCPEYLFYRHLKSELIALSWEFPKLVLSILVLHLSIGCPSIHEYTQNCGPVLHGSTASTRPLLSTWLKFTNQPASYAVLLVLSLIISSLCEHTLGWLEIYLFLMLHRLSGTLSLAK